MTDTELTDSQIALNDTVVAIRRLEAILARRPKDPVATINLASLRRRQLKLEKQVAKTIKD